MTHSDPQAAVLAIIVHDALNGPAATDDARLATLQAAVHAWMEGHVEGEGRAGMAGAVTQMPDDEMPSPPFPDPHNPQLARIIAEAHERLGDAEPVSGALFAAGLAYQAGLAEGAECSGCSARGRYVASDAAQVRAGLAVVSLRAGQPAGCMTDAP
jgi:hypothetical protein